MKLLYHVLLWSVTVCFFGTFIISLFTMEKKCPNIELFCNLTQCADNLCNYTVYVNYSRGIFPCYWDICYVEESILSDYLVMSNYSKNCQQFNSTSEHLCLAKNDNQSSSDYHEWIYPVSGGETDSCSPKCLNATITILMVALFVVGSLWSIFMFSIYCSNERDTYVNLET